MTPDIFYVAFKDISGGKPRPVLVLRKSETDYIVLRVTSKYKNKSKFFQKKYIEIKDWRESNLTKPSWIDTYQTYSLPINKTNLTFIGKLSSRDLRELSKHVRL